MKKLFISCPMSGRTEEAIRKSIYQLHKIAEIIVGEELEVIDSYSPSAEYKDKPIACLGEAIKKMQDADFFIGVNDVWDWRGCYIESEIAGRYGIQTLDISTPVMMPDAVDLVQKLSYDPSVR